ncbi:pentatricopeptide repeat-containing protein At4g14190, chloroplastic [Cynara cardunculus var. scolymus]|nr:pentatricopeptide repeat-containing protein At4g14190, chloroplastic [Cynara cardunculus var. scolymus]
MGMGLLLPSISINDKTFLCKTLVFPKPSSRTLTATKSQFSRSTKTPSLSVYFSRGKTNSDKEDTVQFDDLRQNWNLKRSLFEKLKDKDSDPVRILEEDGDWSKELFWAVVGFLNQTSRSNQVLQVFDKWKSKDDSRVSEFNYQRIIRFLVEEGLVEDAVLSLKEMKNVQNLQASSEIYDSIIHGFIEKGRFEDALLYLKEMEDLEVKPHTSTYNGLIKAYAKNGLYDDMATCVKRMESNGCIPDQSTYNLLIREFSVAGLINMMEKTHRIVISKKMDVEASTMVAMLEVYSNFGLWDKMEKVYKRILRLRPKVYLQDDLIRKVAAVYMENCMFSKLDDMGINLYSKTGNTHIVWCLRMLSHARLLSRTGMESVGREMDYKKVQWSVSVANIMLFGYAKMKDFERLKVVLAEMRARGVKPDIVTCGILWDAHGFGFDGVGELDSWRKMGFFGDLVEFKTDPLVLDAFGKGGFLRTVAELDHRRSKVWTYEHLIELVEQHRHKN